MALLAAIATVAAGTLGASGTGVAATAPGAAFVRVNQAGYPIGSPKRAYLLSSVAEPAASFHVTRADGRVVVSGRVGAALGSWSARYPHVYAIDFSRLRAPGTYTVTVAGAAAASSPPSGSPPPGCSRPGRSETRSPSIRTSATAPASSEARFAPPPGI